MRTPAADTDERPVPPREAARVPVHAGVNVCVSPDEVMVSEILASDDVANVCVDPVCELEYCPLRPVIPPPAPASEPHSNRFVDAFHKSLSPEPEQVASPPPVIVPPMYRFVVVAYVVVAAASVTPPVNVEEAETKRPSVVVGASAPFEISHDLPKTDDAEA